MIPQHLLDDAIDPSEQASPKKSMTDLALEMKGIKLQLDNLDEERKALQARYDAIRKQELVDELAAAQITGFKLDEGGSVHTTRTTQASVKAEDREPFHQWLRDNGHGALIVSTVHPATLKSWVKEMLDAGRTLPPMVGTYIETTVVLRAK